MEETPLPIELHLAGIEPDPEYRRSLTEAARGLRVVFHGPFPVDGLARHPVAAVHAFVSGTRARETWGVVVNESLALGLPMILPRFGAYSERLRPDDGVLFYETGNPASLATVLAEVQRDPAVLDRMRDGLPSPQEAIPTVEEYASRMIEVYEEACRLGAPAVDSLDPREQRASLEWLERWDHDLSTHPPTPD